MSVDTISPMATLADALALLPGARLEPAVAMTAAAAGAIAFTRVHTDTRTLRAGDLFVALQGERFDAHAFLPQAGAAGAVAALATHGLAEAGLPGLQVADTLQALQQLATGWRRRFTGPLIAVTGSNGKTTVTQMVATILRTAHGAQAHATAGNLNNHIGVPLTVLGLRPVDQGSAPAHRAAVVELGMNHPGEIAELARIAQPTVALVNNAQREHQEFMGTVEAVARENGTAIAMLPADGVAVFPAADAFAPLWAELAGTRRCLRFAIAGEAPAGAAVEVCGRPAWLGDAWQLALETPAGAATLSLHVAGRHNVRNALAAAAATLAAGVPLASVVAGLEAFRAVKGRSELKSLPAAAGAEGAAALPRPLIDDTYNANPDSVRAAIDVLAELPGPRWLLLGDMGEVGDQGPAFHAEIGAYAAERGLEHLWCAGTLCAHAATAFGPAARHFDGTLALVDALGQAPAFAAVLVKGSRFMGMERAVMALQAVTPSPSSLPSSPTPSAGAAHAA